MKRFLMMLIILINVVTTYSQSVIQNDFKGIWVTGAYKDSMKLNFLDNVRIFVDLGGDGKMNGLYRVTTHNNDIILSIWPSDKLQKDSLIFTMVQLSKQEYKLTAVVHLYDDGRPPEHLLIERTTYLLRKLKD